MYVCFMKKIAFLSLFSLLAFAACKKDSLGTKPVITFKSYSSDLIYSSYGLAINFNVSDGDGDIQNTLTWAKIVDTNPTDTVWDVRQMPDMEGRNSGKVNAEVGLYLAAIDLNTMQDSPPETDSVHFLAFIIDEAGNSSDTIATPKIFIDYVTEP